MSVRRGLAWMSMAQGGFFILQFASSVVLARLLTPYEMGVYAVAASLVGMLSVLQAFGLSSFLVREKELSPDLVATAFTVNAITAAGLSACIAGLSVIGASALGDPGVQSSMLVIAIQPLVAIPEFLPAALLERHGKFQRIALVSLARTACISIITVGLAWAGFSYMSISYGTLAGAVVSAAGFMLAGRAYVSLRPGLTEWRRIASYGAQMVAISGVTVLSARIGEFIIARMLGLSALGYFGRASQLTALLWENIHMVIVRVVFVDLSDVRRRGEPLRPAYLRIVEMMTALLWPAFAGFGVLAAPLIWTVYGAKWVNAAWPMSLMCVASMILVSITMTWELFVICGETGRQARFEFIRSVISVVTVTAGSLISLNGAAAARIADAAASLALYRPHLDRMTQTSTRDFLPIYARSLGLTLVAIAPSLVLMTMYGWAPAVPPLYVAAAILAGVGGWLSALWALDHPILIELLTLASKARGRLTPSAA